MRLRCGEVLHATEVRPAPGGLEVLVDGKSYRVCLEELGRGTYGWRNAEGRVETFHCLRDGAAVHLFWRGRTYALEEQREGARSSRREHASGLEAPMPGKVIKVSVAPGQRVSKGDEVLVVEAMKMENALRAPREGTVKSVRAEVGDTVVPGVVLVELE
jgi:3-methylcrotonyl-CoA carboxylase alpha subunit